MRRYCSSTLASLCFFAALCVLQIGCLTTVEDACASAAENHCANCFSCADEVDDGVSGHSLCDVPESEGDELADCEAFLTDQCETEAYTREDPYQLLDDCERAVDEETCSDLVDRESQGQPAAPEECRRFL